MDSKEIPLYENSFRKYVLIFLPFAYSLFLVPFILFVSDLIRKPTKDIIAGVLIALIGYGLLIYASIRIHRMKLYTRMLVWCRIDYEGIFCHGFLWKPYMIRWDKIKVYGTHGNNPVMNKQACAFMYFSVDENEQFHEKKWFTLNQQRVVIQIRRESWDALRKYMPSDIKRNMQWSVENRRNCYHKRKPKETAVTPKS